MAVFILWEFNFFVKDIYNFFMKNRTFFAIILNDIKPCVEIFDKFWNIWKLILWGKAEKKQSSCSDDFKYGAFVLGK